MLQGTKFFLTSLMILGLISAPIRAIAVDRAPEGQGFDCKFLAEVSKLESIKIWYGGKSRFGKVPQVEDEAGLFVLGEMVSGRTFSYFVHDEWPEKFTIQFYDKNQSASPLSSLSIDGSQETNGSFKASIIVLPPDLSVGQTVEPTSMIHGMCTTTQSITHEAFVQ